MTVKPRSQYIKVIVLTIFTVIFFPLWIIPNTIKLVSLILNGIGHTLTYISYTLMLIASMLQDWAQKLLYPSRVSFVYIMARLGDKRAIKRWNIMREAYD